MKNEIIVIIDGKSVKLPVCSTLNQDLIKANLSTSASAIFGKVLK